MRRVIFAGLAGAVILLAWLLWTAPVWLLVVVALILVVSVFSSHPAGWALGAVLTLGIAFVWVRFNPPSLPSFTFPGIPGGVKYLTDQEAADFHNVLLLVGFIAAIAIPLYLRDNMTPALWWRLNDAAWVGLELMAATVLFAWKLAIGAGQLAARLVAKLPDHWVDAQIWWWRNVSHRCIRCGDHWQRGAQFCIACGLPRDVQDGKAQPVASLAPVAAPTVPVTGKTTVLPPTGVPAVGPTVRVR